MVDDLTPQNMPPAQGDPVPEVGGKQGFMSTTAGKLVVIAGAVFAFLVVAGIVLFVVFTFVFVDAVDQGVDQIAKDAAAAQSEDASEETTGAPAVEPGPVPLSAIFTFRDIFDPLLKPDPAEEATTTSTTDGTTGGTTDGTTDGTTAGAADTLYLQDVVVENGVSYAVMSYNGVTYTLSEGQSIPGTPWLVLNIYSGSVTMLYGDSQVTLIVGQGVASK